MRENAMNKIVQIKQSGFTSFTWCLLEDNRPPPPLGDGQKLHIVGVLKVSSATKHTVFTEQGFLRVQSNKLRDFRRKNCGQGLKFPPFYTMFRDHVRQTVDKLCAEAVSAVCSKLIRSDIYSVFRYYSTNSFVDEFYMSRISDINLKLQWTRRKWRPCWSAMISFCLPHLHFDQNNTVPEKSMTYLSWDAIYRYYKMNMKTSMSFNSRTVDGL